MTTLDLGEFAFDSKQKILYGYTEPFGGDFPDSFAVRSHHTNKVIEFRKIERGHPAFNEDGWDGEAYVYEPTRPVPNVVICILTHAS